MKAPSKVVKKPSMGADSIRVGVSGECRENLRPDLSVEVAVKSPVLDENALYEKVRQRIAAEFAQALAQQQQTCAERARAEIAQTLSSLEPDLLRLAVAAAEKVCHKEITENQSVIVEVIREGLNVIGRRASAQVHLHPDDIALAEAALPSLGREAGDLQWVSDDSIERGGALFESGSHLLDARVATRLHHVRESVTGSDHAER